MEFGQDNRGIYRLGGGFISENGERTKVIVKIYI